MPAAVLCFRGTVTDKLCHKHRAANCAHLEPAAVTVLFTTSFVFGGFCFVIFSSYCNKTCTPGSIVYAASLLRQVF